MTTLAFSLLYFSGSKLYVFSALLWNFLMAEIKRATDQDSFHACWLWLRKSSHLAGSRTYPDTLTLCPSLYPVPNAVQPRLGNSGSNSASRAGDTAGFSDHPGFIPCILLNLASCLYLEIQELQKRQMYKHAHRWYKILKS